MTIIEMTEEFQGGVLKAIETSQNWTLGAIRATSSAFDTLKPDTSLISFADKVPSPAEAVHVTFGFWSKLLDTQHSFLSGVAELYAPPAARVTTSATTAKKV
jgi:hypothetical protein